MNSRKRLLKDQKLYLIVNLTHSQRPSIAKLRRLLNNGIDILQLRSKGVSDSLFLKYALELRKLSSAYKKLFIINDRVDIALASGADGLHIGQDDIRPDVARKILGSEKIIGLSTHSHSQIDKALSLNTLDYIGIGPVFKTSTKLSAKPIGLTLIRYLSRKRDALAFFAIGGIGPDNIEAVRKAGARRIAVASAIVDSKAPISVLKEIRKVLDEAD